MANINLNELSKIGLNNQAIQDLDVKLRDLGVEDSSDLLLIKEEDLYGVVSVILARKIVAYWKDSLCLDISSDATELFSDSSSSCNAENFVISWKDFPTDIIEMCKNGTVVPSARRSEFVRILVDSVLKWSGSSKPSRAELSTIAKRVIRRYPKSFQDTSGPEGEVIGSGYSYLTQQMVWRIDNLRKSTSKKRSQQPKVEEQVDVDRYGCVLWGPETDNEGELEQLRMWLKHEYTLSKSDQDLGKVEEYMKQTFPLQRKHINQNQSISGIKELWPHLFDGICLMRHYETLVGKTEAKKNILKKLEDNSICIYKTLKCSTNKKISEFISSSKSESKNLKTELPKSTGVVTLIAYYFGEDLNQIFKCFQKETTFPQILEDIPKSPFIACIGNTVATAETFYVIAEREVVCSCRSFFEAVAFQFASFYVFNIEYPNKALLTFDFIQRFFGDINPSGTKSKKSKGKDVNAKVIGLARRVNLSQALYVPLLEIDV
uniref:sterile alpha motif domain-containing protein 3-like n=1 Tax=Styela clava TaxID=7725 RepID=UPI00193ACBCF|nr:sterile alpha motif domain-containing protein 3-like [Styela clava]